ncbi:retrovirus-related Pol polyprotein from transposon 17.6 [Trichonephila clavipes]|nr:retrovirus-related Pol polyprotein from transposon 17.6 [Trichonephila clavipes]
MNSEKRNTDTGHAENQIETSISNQNDFLFNELQYIDVIVDEIPLRATLDSGANSVIINSNEPVLHPFKEGAKLELHTDASKLGLGAVLLQQGEDGFLSYPLHEQKTSIQEEKLCSYELEVLAVIEALKKISKLPTGKEIPNSNGLCSICENTRQRRN